MKIRLFEVVLCVFVFSPLFLPSRDIARGLEALNTNRLSLFYRLMFSGGREIGNEWVNQYDKSGKAK